MNQERRAFTLVELAVVIAVFFVMTAILAPFVRMVKARAAIITCSNNLRKINLGLHGYAIDHDDAFPPDLKALYPDYVDSEKVFDCPATAAVGTPEKPDYKYTSGLNELSGLNEVTVEDIDGNHRKAGKNILRLKGSVEFVSRR